MVLEIWNLQDNYDSLNINNFVYILVDRYMKVYYLQRVREVTT